MGKEDHTVSGGERPEAARALQLVAWSSLHVRCLTSKTATKRNGWWMKTT